MVDRRIRRRRDRHAGRGRKSCRRRHSRSARPMNGPPPSAFPIFDGSKSAETDALTIVGLTVAYRMRGRDREVLQDISFRVRRGEAYGLVGESGCGKSTVAMAALRYLPRNGKVKAGKIIIAGQDVQ